MIVYSDIGVFINRKEQQKSAKLKQVAYYGDVKNAMSISRIFRCTYLHCVLHIHFDLLPFSKEMSFRHFK